MEGHPAKLPGLPPTSPDPCASALKPLAGICLGKRTQARNANQITRSALSPPSLLRKAWKCRNINLLSIRYAFRLSLRTDSPVVEYHCNGNLGLSTARAFTGLAVTHSSILSRNRSTPRYHEASTQLRCSPTTPPNFLPTIVVFNDGFCKKLGGIRTFGTRFSPGIFSAQGNLTSELLRFL